MSGPEPGTWVSTNFNLAEKSSFDYYKFFYKASKVFYLIYNSSLLYYDD